ncbi:hypothetical protein O181_051174 [Austropuccinia psidii MF-1]|uniref:DUF4604 domain-containing protein n=1 Tax=Austropuccinia psidii MF-1 TaxID=1389203 RepID=A0A9Q3DY60_9BASI|nr:hypothetical protein [Austropuccinia psidii MF-1]
MAPRSNKIKPHQFKNLTFTDHRPKFLANIDATLRGSKSDDKYALDGPGIGSGSRFEETEVLDPNRPAIPIRPKESDDEEPQIVAEENFFELVHLLDEDEEPDEEAPMVVVLKEGNHLTKDEAEAEKVHQRDNTQIPLSAPSSSRQSIKPFLAFSTNDKTGPSNGKRKLPNFLANDTQASDDWSELVKKTKGDKAVLVSTIKEEREAAQKASVSKKQRKMELKAKNKKAKSLMSFS